MFFGKIFLPIPAVSFRGIGKAGTKSPSGRSSLGLAPGNSVTLAGQEERTMQENHQPKKEVLELVVKLS